MWQELWSDHHLHEHLTFPLIVFLWIWSALIRFLPPEPDYFWLISRDLWASKLSLDSKTDHGGRDGETDGRTDGKSCFGLLLSTRRRCWAPQNEKKTNQPATWLGERGGGGGWLSQLSGSNWPLGVDICARPPRKLWLLPLRLVIAVTQHW